MGGVSLQKKTPFPPSTATSCRRNLLQNHDDNDTLSCLGGGRRGREDDRDRVTSSARVREVFILTVVANALGDAGSLSEALHINPGPRRQTELLLCVPIMISQSSRTGARISRGFADKAEFFSRIPKFNKVKSTSSRFDHSEPARSVNSRSERRFGPDRRLHKQE